MVHAELGRSSLDPAQKEIIVEMCNGASTMLGYFANMAVGLATALFSFNNVGTGTGRRWATAVASLVVVALISHLMHVARGNLSDVDQRKVAVELTIGTILRLGSILLNVAIFAMLAMTIKP